MAAPYFFDLKLKGLIYLMDKVGTDNKYCVYCHRNKINNKAYIGITGLGVKKRWASNGSLYRNSPHFWNAIQKYGWDNFEHIVLFDNLSKKNACKMEILLIALFNTQDPNLGYNMSSGGESGSSGCRKLSKKGPDGKKVNQYDLNGIFIRTWNSMIEASKALHIYYSCISDCCRGKQKTAGGFIWKYATEEEIEYAKNIIV